jgi:hypothetical protein
MFSRLGLALALIFALAFVSGCTSSGSQGDGPVNPRVVDNPPKDSEKIKPVGVGAGGGGKKQPSSSSQ